MKKFSLMMIIVWSFIGLLIIAALILSTIFSNRRGPDFMRFSDRYDITKMELVVDENIPIQELKKIELKLSADICNIYFTDGDTINVKHYAKDISAGRYADINLHGESLAISTMPKVFSGIAFFGLSSSSVVNITLPENYKEALSVELMSGSISFDDALDVSELIIKLSSGTIRSEHAIKAEELDISVASGSVRISGGIEAKDYALKTSSGQIDIDNKLAGSGSVNVTSGRVRLSGVDITENLSVKASSGSINIAIAGNPSLYYSGHKTSGSIHAYFGVSRGLGSFSGTVGEAPYKNLDISVTSGTVRITQE